jgi:ABC-type multidrug transport system ATPase subunit
MDNKYAGMTVNERLYVSGKLQEFDKAVAERNAQRARAILEEVGLTEESILPILKEEGLQ